MCVDDLVRVKSCDVTWTDKLKLCNRVHTGENAGQCFDLSCSLVCGVYVILLSLSLSYNYDLHRIGLLYHIFCSGLLIIWHARMRIGIMCRFI